MFLQELNKKEGSAFINLVKNLALIDDSFASEEETLIKEYMEEMGLCSKCVETLDQQQALNMLNEASDRVKNIVYFEILGLALVDGDFSEKEVEFLDRMANSFNIKEEKVKAFLGFFRDVNFMYEVTYSDYESKIKELEQMVNEVL